MSESTPDAIATLSGGLDSSLAVCILKPQGFIGPDALLLGKIDPQGMERAAALVVGYSRRADPQQAETLVRVTDAAGTRTMRVERQLTGSAFSMI